MNTSILVKNEKGKDVSQVMLDPKVFAQKIHHGALHQAIVMYQANTRTGHADTKKRDEVRGGGKKPWKQKGTGRARVGSIRSPLWRKGGIVFGPHPRDFGYSIPKKIKILALKSSFIDKIKREKVVLLKSLELADHKTKRLQEILDALNIKNGCLLIVSEMNKNIKLSSRNIPHVEVKRAQDMNAYDVLKHDMIVATEDAFVELEKRLDLTKAEKGKK